MGDDFSFCWLAIRLLLFTARAAQLLKLAEVIKKAIISCGIRKAAAHRNYFAGLQ